MTIATNQTLPYVVHVYDNNGIFKRLSVPLVNFPPIMRSLNAGTQPIELDFATNDKSATAPVQGDLVLLTENGGDGSVLFRGVVQNPVVSVSGNQLQIKLVIGPLVQELGETPFNRFYTVATDTGQIMRDAVNTTKHWTATTTEIPNTGVTAIVAFENSNVLKALDDAKRLTGPFMIWRADDTVQKVLASVVNPGSVSADYTVKLTQEVTAETSESPFDSLLNWIPIIGGMPVGATHLIVSVYDNGFILHAPGGGGVPDPVHAPSSAYGVKGLTQPLVYDGVTDQTTLDNMATTLGQQFNRLTKSYHLEITGYAQRIQVGKVLRIWEPGTFGAAEAYAGVGAYSPNLVVMDVEAQGPMQRVTAADMPVSVQDFQSILDAMAGSAATSGASAATYPVTPPQTSPGNAPALVAGIATSSAVQNVAQAANSTITVSWTANGAGDFIDHYEVRYKKSGDIVYSYLTTFGITLRILGLIPGDTYNIAVQAVNVLGGASGYGADVDQAAAGDSTAPATPTGLIAATTPRGAIITWDPNTELDLQGYLLQVSIGGGDFIDVTGGPSHTTIVTYSAPAGTPSGTSLVFQVQAVDWSGNISAFSSTSVAINTDAITSLDILAEAVTADKIAANSVTAEKLEAVLLLVSMIQAGTAGAARMEMDGDGLRAYDAGNNLVVNIPDDGISPVTINAQVLAQSLIATGNAVLQGTANELALGSSTQLDASQSNPTQPPSLASSFDGVTLPVDASYDTDSTHYTRVGLDYDAVGGAGGATKVFWMATGKPSGNQYALELLASTRAVNRALNLTTDGVGLPLALSRLGSFLYCLSRDGSTGSPTNFGHTGAATTGYDIASGASDNQIRSASAYATSQAGSITSLSVYMGGSGAAVNAKLCIWNSGGTLVGQTATFSAASGRALHTKALTSAVACTAGAVFFIGFWRDPAGAAEWGAAASGSFRAKASGSAPSNTSGDVACGGAYFCGDMQAYGTYTPNTTTYKVRRYAQATLALDATYSAVAFPITPNAPVLTDDGTNIFIVDKGPLAADPIKWQKYDAVMAVSGAVINTTYTASGVAGCKVTAAFAGSADFGAARVAVAWQPASGQGQVDTFDGTGARQVNEPFPFSGTSAKGLAYGDALADGARFWSLPVTGGTSVSLTKHSTWIWTSASSTYWVAYTWLDSNGSGGTHETQVGPRGSIVMGRRQRLVMTAPAIPGAGGVDDPNEVQFYMLPNATDPGATALKQQASQAAITYLATTYNAAGAADPASNNYPAGGSAVLKSEAAGWAFKGDGSRTERFRAGAYRSAAFTTVVGWQALPCDTKLYDPNTNMDIVTNKGRYTAPVAGLYHAVASVIGPLGTNTRVLTALAVNGAEAIRGNDITSTGGTSIATADLLLAAGDYVEAWIDTIAAVAITPGANFQRFTIRYVGASA